MSILKKWTNCVIAFIAGVCGLALSTCTGMVVKGNVDLSALGMGKLPIESITKAHKVLTDSSLYSDAKAAGIGTEFVWMKVFAIFTLVVSILLVVYAVVMLLKNLNVIKSESKLFDIVGIILVALFLVATIGLLVTSNIYANAAIELTKAELLASGIPAAYIPSLPINIDARVGVYQPLMLSISIITAIVYAVMTILNRKKV